MGSNGFQRSRCHEQMINNAFQAWMYITDRHENSCFTTLLWFKQSSCYVKPLSKHKQQRPQETQASREIHWRPFWWIFFNSFHKMETQKQHYGQWDLHLHTLDRSSEEKHGGGGFLGRQICVGEVIIHPSWQDNRWRSQRTQPCLLGFGDLIFIVRLYYAHYILCLPQEHTHAYGRKEHLWMDEIKMSVRAQVETNRGADTQQQQVETNTQQPQMLKFPTVGLPSMPPWLITACTSKKKQAVYKHHTASVCLSLSVSLWSVTQMKLTKTGSGWGARRERSRARQETPGSRMLIWGSVRGLILAPIFQTKPQLEVLGNCQLLPYWETHSSHLEARALQQQSGSCISVLVPDRWPKADDTHINNS